MLPYFLLLVSLLAVKSQPAKVYYALENAEQHFEEFIATHNKQYANKEEKNYRFNVFKENLKKINEHNANHQSTLGITQFTDLSEQEFKSKYTGLRGFNLDGCSPGLLSSNVSAPDSFDWRERGAVTGVKNQGHCSSCWTFSTTGNLEGQSVIKNQKTVSLSEQQLLDCVPTSRSCTTGGNVDYAFAWLSQNGGSMLESDYPYTDSVTTCQSDKNRTVVQVVGCNSYQSKTEDEIKDILVNVGPLSIAVDGVALQHYPGGIYDCGGKTRISHAVLLVGYGNEGGKSYWLVKNSWGTTWGEQGYARLEMHKNSCGITSMISSATIA